MANVFIFPIVDETAKASFGIAIERGYELETLLPLIPDEARMENLRRFFPDGRCYVWGVPDRGDNRSSWKIMSEKDLVLGYAGGSIVSAAHVLMKADDPSLASALWGSPAGGSSRLMFFFDKPHVGEVPIVSQMSGYLDLDYESFTRLKPEKCQAILHAYGTLENFVRLGLRYDFPFSFRHSE